VIVLGVDTATSSTAVALRLEDGSTLQMRDDPDRTSPPRRPGHTTRLLPMVDELLTRANIGWRALERIAVGLGPGTFTGLRVGVATARGLAQSLGIELVGCSSLRALAEGSRTGIEATGPASPGPTRVLAVLDARRGEAFAAAYLLAERASTEAEWASTEAERASTEELVAPRALAPEDLAGILARAEAHRRGDEAQQGREQLGPWRAIGDGAVRFRSHLEAVGVTVPPDSSPLHLVSAVAICDLGARGEAVASHEAIVPDYRRRPDAEIALGSAAK
jgi:tRNA threonylcarbamoyladenosine biosynthesis protein TsaB